MVGRIGRPALLLPEAVRPITLAALCFPFVLVRAHEISENLPRSFWLNISAVAVLTVAGNALLVQAVKLSDLSVLGGFQVGYALACSRRQPCSPFSLGKSSSRKRTSSNV